MKSYYKNIILLIAVIVFNSPIFSQNKLTVEQAITATIENNYDIQLLRNDSSAYALDNAYARAAFLPR
ncbi:MAG TPA: hypothetical protein PLA14_12110, partial [Ferruginibacter sp.]|nr:hypothetical protein [Ferruginibacter sp.]